MSILSILAKLKIDMVRLQHLISYYVYLGVYYIYFGQNIQNI